MRELDVILRDAKQEAFLSLIYEARNSNPKTNVSWLQECSNVHGWLCSKYARLIKDSLKPEGYELNYLK